MKTQKRSILPVAIINIEGQIVYRDTLATLRDWDTADVYDYTAGDTAILESWYDEDEEDYLARASEALAVGKRSIVYDPVAELAFMHADAFDWWQHYLLYVDRYTVVDQAIYRGEPGDAYHEIYSTLEKATEAARNAWDCKSLYDRARSRVYVCTGLEDMHGDYNILTASAGGFDSAATDEIYRREEI